jgi:hypothetical protein
LAHLSPTLCEPLKRPVFARAGADLAVAVGLLLPFSEQKTAAEGRLHALADLPEPADVSLVAVLQARRLWPKADSEPAYSQLAQSLMDHAVLPTGECLFFARVMQCAGAQAQCIRALLTDIT